MFIKMSVSGYESENTEVALLASASEFKIIQDGILDGFLFADYIICMSISEAGDVAVSLLDFGESLQGVSEVQFQPLI